MKYVTYIRYTFAAVMLIVGTLTLINSENLIFLCITLFFSSGFNVYTEIKEENRKIFNIMINSITLIVSVLMVSKLL